jgi:hypothetical protein
MTFARTGRRAIFALAGFAAAYAAPALAADDKSTIGSVMELVGVSSDPAASKIDYSERPKLVLPPRVGDLPPPREGAERPNGWPSDAQTARRRNSDRYARVPNAEPEEKKGLLERALSVGSSSNAPVMDEPGRRMLTEPPSGYRRPTKDLASLRDPEAKKGSWWNPMTYIGGGGDAQTAATGPQGQQAGAESGGLLSSFQMPRFVVKDPGKE